jgi:hypothetical protein
MKKTFKLSHEKIKKPRLVDSIKHEVKKYIKRERNKKLDEGVDFLDFDCKYGKDELTADVIHLSALNKSIDSAVEQDLESFYIEIIGKPGYRTSKPVSDFDENEED